MILREQNYVTMPILPLVSFHPSTVHLHQPEHINIFKDQIKVLTSLTHLICYKKLNNISTILYFHMGNEEKFQHYQDAAIVDHLMRI